MRRKVGAYAAVGFALGMVTGAILWGSQMRRFKGDLFNPNPMRRLAALGYLKGSETTSSARLLRDYVRWERNSGLRRRGERLLMRLERRIQRAG